MRAVLQNYAPDGAGYGTITIYDAHIITDPVFTIRRISDGKFLGEGGWIDESASLVPQSWNNDGDAVLLRVGPSIVDDLSTSEQYIFELVGIGECALELSGLLQSRIAADNGVGTYAPPPVQPETAPVQPPDIPPDIQTIYEGVEQTPEDIPGYGGESGPSGVASADIPPARPSKRYGCILLCAFLLFIWIGGGWALWHAAMTNPASNSNEVSISVEIIPKSTDTSVANDDFTDGKENNNNDK